MECLTLTGGGHILTTFCFSADRQIFSSVKMVSTFLQVMGKGNQQNKSISAPLASLQLPLEMR